MMLLDWRDGEKKKSGTCMIEQRRLTYSTIHSFVFSSCYSLIRYCPFILVDQMEVVQHKLTHIDRLKGLRVGGNLAGIAEVFGVPRQSSSKKKRDDDEGDDHAVTEPEEAAAARFRVDWLLPWVRGACFPANLQDEIMGFCVGTRRHDHRSENEEERREASGLTDIV